MTFDGQGLVDEALLTETGSGGVLRDGYLADRPLKTYLESAERPRIVFASGHQGVVHDVGTEETVHAPGSGYRVLVALTDRRAVIVVGDDDGDRSFEIPFDALVEASADTGFRRSRVTLRTESGDAWHLYPAGIDAEDVRKFLETAADAWNRFETQFSTAGDALDSAGTARVDGDLEAAEAACDRAESALSAARTVHREFDDTVSAMERRLESIREECFEERRELVRDRARSRVERAEQHWREGAYERAADEYERARERLESFLERDCPGRTATPVREDLAAIDRNCERLGEAPLRRALALERTAERADDPETAIDRWWDAYEGFRTVLELDWGREQSRFDGETDTVRERLEAAVTGLLDARRQAADRRCQDAERLAEEGQSETARAAYGDAVDHLEAAISTAQKLAPAELDDIRNRLEDIEFRIDSLSNGGQHETEDANVENSGARAVTDEGERTDDRDSEEKTDEGERTDDGGGERETDTERLDDEASEGNEDPDSGPRRAGSAGRDGDNSTAEKDEPTPRSENGNGTAENVALREARGTPDATDRSGIDGRDISVTTPERGAGPDRYVDYLRTLDGEQVIDTVVDVWRVLGWSTDRIEDGEADIIARRPDEARPMLLSVRSQGAPLGARGVHRLGDVAKDHEDDPTPVLVTTDPVDPSAFEVAMLRGLTLVDAPRLDELARSTGVHPAIDADSVPDRQP